MNRKISVIVFVALVLSIFLLASSVSAATKIDQKTVYDRDGDEKLVWKTYVSKKNVVIKTWEYEKKRGRWVLDEKERIVLKKINKNTLRMITYEGDGDVEYDYFKTKRNAKSFYINILQPKLRYKVL